MQPPPSRMPRLALPALVTLALVVACTSVTGTDRAAAGPPPAAADAPRDAPGSDMAQCHAEDAQSLVGRAGDAATVERVRTLTGSASVRVIRPGQAVTMDYDGRRVNVDVDARGAIVAIRCG